MKTTANKPPRLWFTAEKYGVSLSRQRIGSWWREQKSEKPEAGPEQLALISVPEQSPQEIESDSASKALVGEAWQPNQVAGCFMLYAMLLESWGLTNLSD